MLQIGWRPAARAGRRLFLTLALALAPCAGLAHSGGTAGPVEGIAIPAITHGQMRALAPYRGAILSLAQRYLHGDEELRRLTNHARIQFAWCLWGLAPGSVSDETSPFNACAHAYLAATRAVLLRLGEIAPDAPDLRALRRRVDGAMLEHSAALEFCGFSFDAYDTAGLVHPEWRGIVGHGPSLALFVTAGGAIFAGGFGALRLTRRRTEG